MEGKNILIVEDEVLIADGIKTDLEQLGYQVPMPPCASFEQAVESLKNMRPDLVLLDIRLKGKLTGIDLAAFINEQFGIPFLFLTSHLSPDVFEEVRRVQPAGFITKPYLPQNLWANIELALCRKQTKQENKALSLQGAKGLEKNELAELLYLEADGSYTRFHFENKNFLKRKNLKQAMEEMPEGLLIQVHRSYAVNPQKVTAFSSHQLFIQKLLIPISRSKQQEILQLLRTK